MSLISFCIYGLKTCQTKYGKKAYICMASALFPHDWLISTDVEFHPLSSEQKKTHPALLRQIRKIIQAQTTRSRTTGQGVSDQMFTFGRGSRSGKKHIISSYTHQTNQSWPYIMLQICKDEYRLCLEICFSCESASTPMRRSRKIQEGFSV